ncbi:MAG: transcriptional repressor [Herbinix sp.]|nr:transcriptional repressor [Herbinix sp.]
MKNEYRTKQRQLILSYLKNNKETHVSVHHIVSYLREKDTPVGITTVYRSLNQLVEKGRIHRYYFQDDKNAYYQFIEEDATNRAEAYDCKCIQCGKLVKVDCDFMQQMDNHLFEHHKFRVNNRKTIIYGQCEDCFHKISS